MPIDWISGSRLGPFSGTGTRNEAPIAVAMMRIMTPGQSWDDSIPNDGETRSLSPHLVFRFTGGLQYPINFNTRCGANIAGTRDNVG